jgi:hypothetical protein
LFIFDTLINVRKQFSKKANLNQFAS